MASYTTNYNLKKPDATDFINVGDLNDNADLIDNAISRKNWFKNSCFHIWQSGTSFTAPSNIYTADMFICNGSGSVAKVDGGMQITGTVNVKQKITDEDFAKLNGKTVTLSYSLSDVITSSTFVLSDTVPLDLDITDKIFNWVKLEEGSGRTRYEYSNSDDDLIYCRQHYLPNFYGETFVYQIGTNEVYFAFNVPCMRLGSPTITITSATVATSGATGYTWEVTYNEKNRIAIKGTKTSHGVSVGAYARALITMDARL